MNIKTYFRGWKIEADEHAVICTKFGQNNGEQFEIRQLPDLKAALEFGKRAVFRREQDAPNPY